MSFSQTYKQTLVTPEEQWNDDGTTYTSDTTTAVNTSVDAYGGSTNSVTVAFGATNGVDGLQSLGLLATVPCTVTFTGATTVDGAASNIVTLAANVMRHIVSITGGACTLIVVSANTDSVTPGIAGTIKISAVYKT